MAGTAFTVFKGFGNANRAAEGGSRHKEGAPISIFGSAIDQKKNNYPGGRGTGFLGMTKRLAECVPSVKTPPGK